MTDTIRKFNYHLQELIMPTQEYSLETFQMQFALA